MDGVRRSEVGLGDHAGTKDGVVEVEQERRRRTKRPSRASTDFNEGFGHLGGVHGDEASTRGQGEEREAQALYLRLFTCRTERMPGKELGVWRVTWSWTT